MNIYLTREVNSKLRYYSLELYKGLFGEYWIEKSYGSCSNKLPTRVTRNFYSSIEEAKNSMIQLISSKKRKGYR